MKLLLHTCCGPCFLGTWEELSAYPDFDISCLYYNPNISPEDELEKRLDNLRIASLGLPIEIIELGSAELDFLNAVREDISFPKRCTACYALRLRATASYASQNDFDAFSTTLLVSPYQNHELLKELGEKVGQEFGVKFHYVDWRPYFRAGQEEAKEKEMYRQKYCGCRYSLSETGQK